MGQDVQKATYEGYQKYPGIIATVITVLVGGIFLGALYNSATHHDGGHSSDHSSTEESAEH